MKQYILSEKDIAERDRQQREIVNQKVKDYYNINGYFESRIQYVISKGLEGIILNAPYPTIDEEKLVSGGRTPKHYHQADGKTWGSEDGVNWFPLKDFFEKAEEEKLSGVRDEKKIAIGFVRWLNADYKPFAYGWIDKYSFNFPKAENIKTIEDLFDKWLSESPAEKEEDLINKTNYESENKESNEQDQSTQEAT
jgi:hypothetical protein